MGEDFYPERRRTNPASGQGRTWTWEPGGGGGGVLSYKNDVSARRTF